MTAIDVSKHVEEGQQPSHTTKLAISGVALIPFVAAAAILLVPMYLQSGGKPLLGEAWKDALMCVAAFVTFFASSFALMYAQLSLP